MIGTDTMRNDLDGLGYGVVRNLLSKQECGEWICAYGDSRLFRKKIVMEAHAYGLGEYQYFRYPLPDRIRSMRSEWYRVLAPIANEWNQRLGVSFPVKRTVLKWSF